MLREPNVSGEKSDSYGEADEVNKSDDQPMDEQGTRDFFFKRQYFRPAPRTTTSGRFGIRAATVKVNFRNRWQPLNFKFLRPRKRTGSP